MGITKKEVREKLVKTEYVRKRVLQPYFIEIGLTVGQGQPRILNRLYECGHVTQKELADACGMDVTTLSRTLDRLCEAGLVCRKQHPECRRALLIDLTEAGVEKAKQVREGFDKLDELIWKGFTEAEMKQFLRYLDRVEQNLCGEG